ncbi:MAG TPA: DRTGG domain-containing protein [Chloroflexota bacterium]|nr:DRTGG domain-containing protein [Chloroflexota bacterium]
MSIILVSSPEENSGKTAAIVALGQRLRRQGTRIDYRRTNGTEAAADAAFVSLVFRSGDGPSVTPVDSDHLAADLSQPPGPVDVKIVEVDSAALFNPDDFAALRQLGARSLVVARFRPDGLADAIVEHAGRIPLVSTAVLINCVPDKGRRLVDQRVVPSLNMAGLTVIGVVPQDRALLGLSVGDLARSLGADVLCARDALDEPVEGVMISAMSDEGAEHYFQRLRRKAVIAGGDRPDIHMPALATDTTCIVLTEGYDPDPTVLKTADEQSIPLLKVSPSTVETLDHVSDALVAARFRQTFKVARAVTLFGSNVGEADLDQALDLVSGRVAI